MHRLPQALQLLQQCLRVHTAPLNCQSLALFATSTDARAQQGTKKKLPDKFKDKQVEVVLLQDVYRFGRKGEVRSALAGYVRHALFPYGKAVYATPENVAKFAKAEAQSQGEDKELEVHREVLRMLRQLSHTAVSIRRKAARTGSEDDKEKTAASSSQVGDSEDSGSAAADGTQQAKMVGSVTPFDILQAVKNQLGIQLDPSHLLMDRQITTFGTHKVPLNFKMPDNRQIELELVIHKVRKLRHGMGSAV